MGHFAPLLSHIYTEHGINTHAMTIYINGLYVYTVTQWIECAPSLIALLIISLKLLQKSISMLVAQQCNPAPSPRVLVIVVPHRVTQNPGQVGFMVVSSQDQAMVVSGLG